jgi:hypothetical protein
MNNEQARRRRRIVSLVLLGAALVALGFLLLRLKSAIRNSQFAIRPTPFRLDREPVWAVPPEGVYSPNGPPENPQDFGDFCHALAGRYRGRVRAYQVWNEPNLAREWGGRTPDPVEYVELLRACYIGIKTADPDALVISAGLSPTGNGPPEAMPDSDYLIGMYEARACPRLPLSSRDFA